MSVLINLLTIRASTFDADDDGEDREKDRAPVTRPSFQTPSWFPISKEISRRRRGRSL